MPDRAVNRAAEVLRDQTKKLPPVNVERSGWETPGIPVAPLHGGTLRQSIQKRRLGLLASEVYTGVNYGKFVHDGTSKMRARPYFRWMLENFQGKEMLEAILLSALERVANP